MGDQPKRGSPKTIPQAKRLRKIAIGVLLIGLSVAAPIFAMAPPETEDNYMGTYVATVGDSKKYQHELEVIGGKGAVLAAEFSDWFGSLWHGKRLAGTIAVISVGVSLFCFFISTFPPPEE